MTCWAIIPVKAVEGGKSRLAGVLDEAARAELVRVMAAHVVAAAESAVNVDRICLVGPSRLGLPRPFSRESGLCWNRVLATW